MGEHQPATEKSCHQGREQVEQPAAVVLLSLQPLKLVTKLARVKAKAEVIRQLLQELKKPLNDASQAYFFLRRELEALLHI